MDAIVHGCNWRERRAQQLKWKWHGVQLSKMRPQQSSNSSKWPVEQHVCLTPLLMQ